MTISPEARDAIASALGAAATETTLALLSLPGGSPTCTELHRLASAFERHAEAVAALPVALGARPPLRFAQPSRAVASLLVAGALAPAVGLTGAGNALAAKRPTITLPPNPGGETIESGADVSPAAADEDLPEPVAADPPVVAAPTPEPAPPPPVAEPPAPAPAVAPPTPPPPAIEETVAAPEPPPTVVAAEPTPAPEPAPQQPLVVPPPAPAPPEPAPPTPVMSTTTDFPLPRDEGQAPTRGPRASVGHRTGVPTAVSTRPIRTVRTTAVPHAASRRVAIHRSTTYAVRPGDSLWSIARGLLPTDAGPTRIAQLATRLWLLNAARIPSGDPDLLHVGTQLRLPANPDPTQNS